MNATKSELLKFETLKDLKGILGATGPCVSIYLPLSRQNALRWRESIDTARGLAGRYDQQGRELLDSIASWDAIAPDQQIHGKSIAVFRSPDVFAITILQREVQDRIRVGPHFFIRPLLNELQTPASFFLLALSQKDVRLLRCSDTDAEEVPFADQSRLNFDTWMNSAQPDHNDRKKGVTGPSGGRNTKVGAIAPMGADEEDKGEYLAHFFKQIDAKVNELLKGRSEPLVIAAVEYEQPIYRAINSYPHLIAEAVHGAPNSLKSGEMHARALEALQRAYERSVDEALAEWNHKVGSGASSRTKEVVTAAHDGRVLTLLISDSLELTGTFNEAEHKVVGRETGGINDEDLVNDAAVQTILHAGNVLVAPHNKMPNGAPAAAIFRFQTASA